MEVYLVNNHWDTEDPEATMRDAEKLALEYRDLFREHTRKFFELADLAIPEEPAIITTPQDWITYLAEKREVETRLLALRKELQSLQYEQVTRLQTLHFTIPAQVWFKSSDGRLAYGLWYDMSQNYGLAVVEWSEDLPSLDSESTWIEGFYVTEKTFTVWDE